MASTLGYFKIEEITSASSPLLDTGSEE